MNYDEFVASLSSPAPPEDLSPVLKALWYDGGNNWEASHGIAQEIYDRNGSWVHAYLHRKEGDLFNAGYWYRKAGRDMPSCPLEREWEDLVRVFLR